MNHARCLWPFFVENHERPMPHLVEDLVERIKEVFSNV
jgi:hypothetical protein